MRKIKQRTHRPFNKCEIHKFKGEFEYIIVLLIIAEHMHVGKKKRRPRFRKTFFISFHAIAYASSF